MLITNQIFFRLEIQECIAKFIIIMIGSRAKWICRKFSETESHIVQYCCFYCYIYCWDVNKRNKMFSRKKSSFIFICTNSWSECFSGFICLYLVYCDENNQEETKSRLRTTITEALHNQWFCNWFTFNVIFCTLSEYFDIFIPVH